MPSPSRFRLYIRKNQKYAPVIFFICGFLWDSLTLGRIDRLYDRMILITYLISLTYCIYLFNLSDDGRWKETFFEKYEEYLPLAIQFFLGGLSSAYVIYFSRSVSFSKTLSFFSILVILLFANELLKKRISNKYMQFSAYFFVNFTFFTFFIPVLIKSMNTFVFLISGAISFSITLMLIIFIYDKSPSTRLELNKGKIFGLITGIYLMINLFYFLNLIPPVPLALEEGFVAYNVEKSDDYYTVTYEKEQWYNFWDDNNNIHFYTENSDVYVYSSIFAPTKLTTTVAHRWKWYNDNTEEWEDTDRIEYEITGGRDGGYRGYTYKSGMMEGLWKVDVITESNQIIGIVNFEIRFDSTGKKSSTVTSLF